MQDKQDVSMIYRSMASISIQKSILFPTAVTGSFEFARHRNPLGLSLFAFLILSMKYGLLVFAALATVNIVHLGAISVALDCVGKRHVITTHAACCTGQKWKHPNDRKKKPKFFTAGDCKACKKIILQKFQSYSYTKDRVCRLFRR